MTTKSKTRDGLLSSLDEAIDVLNLTKEISNAAPVTAVFGSVDDHVWHGCLNPGVAITGAPTKTNTNK
jgi:hypothetical protein